MHESRVWNVGILWGHSENMWISADTDSEVKADRSDSLSQRFLSIGLFKFGYSLM